MVAKITKRDNHVPPNEEHNTTYSLDKSINPESNQDSRSLFHFVENTGEMWETPHVK